eukprot:superscaffoldBa00004778_g19430
MQRREEIKELQQQYKNVVYHMNASGADRETFCWFDTVDAVLGGDVPSERDRYIINIIVHVPSQSSSAQNIKRGEVIRLAAELLLLDGWVDVRLLLLGGWMGAGLLLLGSWLDTVTLEVNAVKATRPPRR